MFNIFDSVSLRKHIEVRTRPFPSSRHLLTFGCFHIDRYKQRETRKLASSWLN
jgi:hypothetical protein